MGCMRRPVLVRILQEPNSDENRKVIENEIYAYSHASPPLSPSMSSILKSRVPKVM